MPVRCSQKNLKIKKIKVLPPAVQCLTQISLAATWTLPYRPLFHPGGAGFGGQPLPAQHSDHLLLHIQVSLGMRVVIEAGRPKEPIAEEVAGTQREEGGVKGQHSKAQGDGGEKRLKSLRTPGREKEEGTEVEWPGRIWEIQEGADLLGAS